MVDIGAVRSLAQDYSLEMTARDTAQLRAAAPHIPQGARISIAFLPNESMEDRVLAASAVRDLGFVPVPHLSARRFRSEPQLHEFLQALQQRAKVQDVFVVGGDPPAPEGPFQDALDLIRRADLKGHGILSVGVGGYPEGHPAITGPVLQDALLAKLEELDRQGQTASITTQFGFDAAPILTWLEAQRRYGVEVPVRVGLPGPASIKTLLKFAARCGVETSASVMKKYGLSLSKLLSNAGPDVLFDELLAGLQPTVYGPVRVHLYPFGGISQSAQWVLARTGRAPNGAATPRG